MTPLTDDRPAVGGPRRAPVVRGLALVEARRMLRGPWLWCGLVLTALVTRNWSGPESWSGEQYQTWFLNVGGLVVAATLVTAGSFHRERTPLAEAAPGGEAVRCAARLVAAGVLVALTAACTAAFAIYLRAEGGLTLGHEPGLTRAAQPTLPELLQPVALTVVAVALGAALGRRVRHRVTAVLVALLVWFPALFVYWAFQAPGVAPFALALSHPVAVEVGPPATDPTTFPGSWLLEAPGEYQDHWARLVVSQPLAWWHLGWLLSVAALLLCLAVPGGRARRVLAVGGAVLAVVALAAQWQVHPS